MAMYPDIRMRRLRRTPSMRRLVRETSLSVDNIVQPLFVVPGVDVRREIPSMPGIFHLSTDRLLDEARDIFGLGIPAVILFGLPESKDDTATTAYDPSGIVQEAVRTIKREVEDLAVITDVCLCQYTSHGHCGLVVDDAVDNDETLALLARTAVSHAAAGADIVAPSDMMDGRVAAIREALDDEGYHDTAIMSYAAKYASAFYGPFRDAAESRPGFGDRCGYQMDPANAREALREVELDLSEGADMVLVKPALPYLDVLRQVRDTFPHPLAAYHVSGEYSMVKAAAAKGWVDERNVVMESLTAMRRAGADIVITYHARDAAAWLR